MHHTQMLSVTAAAPRFHPLQSAELSNPVPAFLTLESTEFLYLWYPAYNHKVWFQQCQTQVSVHDAIFIRRTICHKDHIRVLFTHFRENVSMVLPSGLFRFVASNAIISGAAVMIASISFMVGVI